MMTVRHLLCGIEYSLVGENFVIFQLRSRIPRDPTVGFCKMRGLATVKGIGGDENVKSKLKRLTFDIVDEGNCQKLIVLLYYCHDFL